MIRLILEVTMELSFCCILNIKFGGIENPSELYAGEWFTFIWSVILYIILLSSPIAIWVFYNSHFDELYEPEFEEVYGAAYDGLYVQRREVLWYPILFTIRRLVFAILCLYLRAYGVI